MKKLKIFIGTRETSGYFGILKEGFKKLGYYCKFYDFYSHNFSYGLDDNKESKTVKLFVKYIEKIEKNKLKGLNKIFVIIFTYILSFIIFLKSCVIFNVFIFYSNSGFWRLKPWDYYILKFFRKKIIFVSLGTDIRPPYLNGKFINDKRYSLDSIYRETKKVLLKIKRMESIANYIVSYPAHSQLLNKKFINGLIIGNPAYIYETEIKNNLENIDKSKINILHAPSHPESKGTFLIREVIEKLKEKGYPINYVEISNKPHSEVLKEIKNCDFVIDQLYSDTPLPLLSVEAGLFKKPSIVAGYYSEFIEYDLKNSKSFPLFVCPEKIFEVAENLCKSKELCKEIGEKVYNFLIKNWSCEIITMRFIKLIEDKFPDDWWYEPYKIKYIYGYGISKNELLNFINMYIGKFSLEGLFQPPNSNFLINLKKMLKIANDDI